VPAKLQPQLNREKRAVRWSARSALALIVAGSFLCSFGIDLPSALASSAEKKPKQDPSLKGLPVTELSADEAIQHALNRLAYGPRPGDVERIKQMGLAKWIDQQLNPNTIDDRAVEARLENYPTLQMSTASLLAEYPQPKQAEKQAIKNAQAQTQAPVTQSRSDAAAAIVASDMRASKGQKTIAAKNVSANANTGQPQTAQVAVPTANAPTMKDAPSPMKSEAGQGNPATTGAGGGNKLSVDPNAVPRAIADDSKRPQRVVEELAMAKVTRAIYSERQLQQVMDDFWFNHFNVFAQKGEVKWYLTSYERDVIQPHTLGKFKDLVEATAKSPAMLFYLDNFLSADPHAAQRAAAERAARRANRGRFGGWPRPVPMPQQQQNKRQERGLNENYGRELMELHTLGVDGGYTQKDVTEVARCFTGWTIDKPRENPEFKFDERVHDPDMKIVLGKKIQAGGMNDGKEVIEMLAKHPSTAKFISTKLARRFVSDNPPGELIARMAQTFQSRDGDIRAVMHTMIYSPEFWSREAFRAKIKTPYELVISAARALGTDVDTPMPLVQWTGRIGEPLYECQPPTGYSDKADAWVNTGALLNRLNFSLALAGNRVRGSHSDAMTLLGLDSSADPKMALDRGVQLFLGGEAARATVETLEKQIEDPQILQAKLDDPVKRVDMGVVTGLVLGAPEFQRR
jgi:uncharacterized protein (DUF1800 family)